MAQTPQNPFTLKSSHNNKYLAYKEDGENSGLLLFSADEESPLTTFQAESAKSGKGFVHLKCNNKYLRAWSLNNYLVAAEAVEQEEDSSESSSTLFKLSEDKDDAKSVNVFSAYHRKNLSHEPYSHCLSAAVQSDSSKNLHAFIITEQKSTTGKENLVLVSVEIREIKFRLNEATIHDKTVNDMNTAIAQNDNGNTNQEKEVALNYVLTESRTWNISGGDSTKSDVPTTIKSAVPFILNETTVLERDEFSGPYGHGKPKESTHGVKTAYKIVVPPRKRVIVALKATRATFKVPFSYTVLKTYDDGSSETTQATDGIFTGVNFFDFKYETRQSDLRR